MWDEAELNAVADAFVERFCPWDDGQAAERVARRVLELLAERG